MVHILFLVEGVFSNDLEPILYSFSQLVFRLRFPILAIKYAHAYKVDRRVGAT